MLRLTQRCRSISAGLATTAALISQSPSDAARLEFFEQRIRPVLASSCYECHSTHGTREGDVVLDHRAPMRGESSEGPIVVPGAPDRSVLLMVMRHELEGLEMPKDGAPLTDKVVSDFEQWIRNGAVDPRDQPPSKDQLANQTSWTAKLQQRRSWWSLQPVVAHRPPPADGWSAHPVDRFAARAQRERGLARAPRAGRRVLLRRLHYVLTGLPPSPLELLAFERDDGAHAFEREVDRLLASPAYGEHWARHWMDVVRYADSHGSEGDPKIPYAHRYRDYLIRAFNDDVPYDQLVREHIAGDLLEQPRRDAGRGIDESTLGTAHYRFVFHGYLPTKPLEEKVRFVDDQINVIGKAFLGHTIACARCHDHKFDAISQADYYALFGVLSSCRPGILDANSADRQLEGVETIRAHKQQLRARLGRIWREWSTTELPRLIADVPPDAPIDHPASLLRDVDRKRHPGSPSANTTFAESLRQVVNAIPSKTSQEQPPEAARTLTPTASDEWFAYGNGLEQGCSQPGAFAVARDGGHVLHGIYPAGTYTHLATRRHRGVLHSRRFDVGKDEAAYALVFGRGAQLRLVVQDYPRSGLTFSRTNLDHDEWRWQRVDLSYWHGDRAHVELTTNRDAPVEASGGAEGFFGLREVRIQPASLPAPSTIADPYQIAAGVRPALPNLRHRQELVTLLCRRISGAVDRWAADRCTDGDALLLDACVRHGLLPNTLDDCGGVEELVETLRRLAAAVPEPTRIPGLIEADATDHPLFERGDPSQPGELVPRRFLEVLGGTRYDGKQSGRRALADDIASPNNPLTARVMVNRVWHHVFGRGLVATPDNFGQLGAKPTHPQLLDHLAARFVADGWSIKRLIRHLVTSKSWQLASAPPPESAATDPDGKWLAAARVRRLTAESLRDSLFAVAGSLSDQIYGAPFDTNSNAPRRSVYVRAQRNDLDQFLATFDAPTPFAPVGARLATNVPAQSLAMLNDPLVWEQAERWAAATAAIPDDRARAAGMFEAATGRRPTDAERDHLLAYLKAAESANQTRRSESAATEAAIADVRAQLATLLDPARDALVAAGKAQPGPEPHAAWDFTVGVNDQVGALHGTLRGSARLDARGLVLDGDGWLKTAPLPHDLVAKTLEAWVQLDDLDQRGGGVLTVQDQNGDIFDSIVYGERQHAMWIAGSDHFRRTDDVDGTAEDRADRQPVHIAAVYDGHGRITLYREGKPYGRAYDTGVARFEADKAHVLIGMRHGLRAHRGRTLRGHVRAARLYDRALTAEEVAASTSGRPYVSRREIVQSLPARSRERVTRLDAALEDLHRQRERHEGEAIEHGPWTLLAHALFNLKEFQFLR